MLLDDATELWGIRVARVEIKDVRIPVQLQRSMAAEAEATREARARVRATARGEPRVGAPGCHSLKASEGERAST